MSVSVCNCPPQTSAIASMSSDQCAQTQPSERLFATADDTGRVTVRLPDVMIDDIDTLIDDGVFDSRSEAIRYSVYLAYVTASDD